MIIIWAEWSPKGNRLYIQCRCLQMFWYRSDQFKIRCPFCFVWDSALKLEERYMRACGLGLVFGEYFLETLVAKGIDLYV